MDFSPGFASADYGTAVRRVSESYGITVLLSVGEDAILLLSTNMCGHNSTTTMSLMQVQCLKIHVICYWLFTMCLRVLLYC